MDRFDRDILNMILRWAPYGGIPEDVAFTTFGLRPIQLGERVERVLEEGLGTRHLTLQDVALLARVRAYRRVSRSTSRPLVSQAYEAKAESADRCKKAGRG